MDFLVKLPQSAEAMLLYGSLWTPTCKWPTLFVRRITVEPATLSNHRCPELSVCMEYPRPSHQIQDSLVVSVHLNWTVGTMLEHGMIYPHTRMDRWSKWTRCQTTSLDHMELSERIAYPIQNSPDRTTIRQISRYYCLRHSMGVNTVPLY